MQYYQQPVPVVYTTRSRSTYPERYMLLSLFLALSAFVLLTLATFSTPFIKSIYYLTAVVDGRDPTWTVKFGTYGFCFDDDRGGCERSLGYRFGTEVTYWLTKAEITVGLAAAFALLAVIALVMDMTCHSSYTYTNPVYFRLAAAAASLSSILATVFCFILWYTARIRFDAAGQHAPYGPAAWILLGGMVAAVLSLLAGGPRYTGSMMHRADNQAVYAV